MPPDPTALPNQSPDMAQEKPIASTEWDLFLSYSRADTKEVIAIRSILQARGISTFFDREQLLAGLSWPQALEQGLRKAKGVAVFIGPSGLGLWQKREMAFALDRQVAEEKNEGNFPVVPVLLPGADVTPGFLFLNTWIDLRSDPTDPEGLDALCKVMREGVDVGYTAETGSLCPYQGLRPFKEESAAFFCGREVFAQRIKETLLQRGLVVVIGPSGSGKSSVVQAGLLPLLRRERPPALTWDVATFIPGDHPFQQLAMALMPLLEPDLATTNVFAEANQLAELLREGKTTLLTVVDRILTRSKGTNRLLIIADQFEELFTLCEQAERQDFLDRLFQTDGESRLGVVITMRGSFYGYLIGSSRSLSDRMENSVINLGPMTREELNKGIVGPAKRLGLSFEPGLAKQMLDEVGEEPGNLPLLEFALTELWTRREGKVLTHAAYGEIGGVGGAIVRRAETIYESLNAGQKSAAKQTLMRLVWISTAANNAQEAGQRIAYGEFSPDSQKVIQILADARLLVIGHHGVGGEFTVEVAHEALIRKWSRLRTWLDEDREFLLWRRRLKVSREIWQQNRDDNTTLLRGTPLLEAERWLTLREDALDGDDSTYIQACLSVEQRKHWIQHRNRRRALVIASSLAAIFMLLACLAIMESLSALSQELVAKSFLHLKSDPELSLFLGIQAVKANPSNESADILKLALQSPLLATLEYKRDFLLNVRFSPDGNRIAATGKDRQPFIVHWDGMSLGEAKKPMNLPDPITIIGLKDDWSMVVAAEKDFNARLIATPSGKMLGKLEGHQGQLVTATFSPDGTQVVTTSEDDTARLWDVHSLRTIKVFKGHKDDLTSAEFSPDGTRIVTASQDQTAIIWDVQTGAKLLELTGHQAKVNNARYSPDGKHIVTSSGDNAARIWDANTGKLSTWLEGHVDSITFATYSPADPNLILTVSRDRTGKVWRKSTDGNHTDWHSINELHGHTDILTSAAFSPDGKYIVTASRDRSIRIWNSLTEHGRLAYYGHTGAVNDAVFSPDGRWAVSASSDNTARLWDTQNLLPPVILNGHKDSLNSVNFNRNGKLITSSDDHTAKIWDIATGGLLQTLNGHTDTVNRSNFNNANDKAITASDDTTARIWDINSGKTLIVLDGLSNQSGKPYVPQAQDTAFSANGALVATLENGHSVLIRDVETRKILAELTIADALFSALDFSPNSERIATADRQGRIQLWDTKTWQRVANIKAHQGAVNSIAFSNDSQFMATAGEDHTLRLWNTSTAEPAAKPFIHSAPLSKAEFSDDGKTLIGTTIHGEFSAWNLATGSLIGSICSDCSSLGGHTKRVLSAEFSPDGTLAVTASRDGTARVWDTASGRPLSVLNHDKGVVGAKFSPNGKLVLTFSRDDTARLWRQDGVSFTLMRTLKGHIDDVTSGEFSPDGRFVATASRDATVKVWETATGELVYNLKYHYDWVNSVEFSPDGSLLLTASMDSTAIVWNMADGSMKLELRGHSDGVRRARFSMDGTQVMTASEDGTLRVWNLKEIEDKKSCPECSGSISDLCAQAIGRVKRTFTAEERKRFHVPWFLQLLSYRCSG